MKYRAGKTSLRDNNCQLPVKLQSICKYETSEIQRLIRIYCEFSPLKSDKNLSLIDDVNIPMKTLALFIIALVSWTTIITQLAITTESLSNLFSYFTILSNILVAVCSSFLLIPATSALGSFFKRTSVQTAIALYIFIVALVYNVVLRWLFDFKGLQMVVDNFLHVVVPVIFVLYW